MTDIFMTISSFALASHEVRTIMSLRSSVSGDRWHSLPGMRGVCMHAGLVSLHYSNANRESANRENANQMIR